VTTSEARFQLALANSGVLAFEHDTALRYTWIYPTQFYAVADVIGRTDAELFGSDDAARLMSIKRRVLETGLRASEEVFIIKDGHRHDYRLTVEPKRDEHGSIVGLTGVSMNISEAKRTQNELRDALAFRDKVLGILGHDLRNPLGAISMGAQTLLLTSELSEDARRHIVRIERSSKRMAEMITTLLDFADSRFKSSISVSLAEVDLSPVVRAVVDELRASALGREIELTVEGDMTGAWDAARLEQVASNIVGNALKHGDGLVQVRLTAEIKDVVLTVSNRGTPIPVDRIHAIFQPFHAPPTAAQPTAQRSLGLGLYIADQIVRAHHGSITVTSTAENGTIFSVRLPRGRHA
jgi:signal transduction histidine kinase